MHLFSRIKKTIHQVGYSTGLSRVISRLQHVSRIIMYHGVGSKEMPISAFKEHILYLSKYYSIVPLADIIEKIEKDCPLRNDEVALTFDDGLRNNYKYAYPILQEHDASATFFVCPGLIETGQWIWTHDVRERLNQLSDFERINLFKKHSQEVHCGSDGFVEWLKRIPNTDKNDIIENIIHDVPNFVPDEQQCDDFDIISWEELKKLDPELITIGSHTNRHPILTSLETKELVSEIKLSKQLLENKLDRPVELFCYPNGNNNTYVNECVKSTYRAAVTTNYGFVTNEDKLFSLSRIPACSDIQHLAWRMHRPRS